MTPPRQHHLTRCKRCPAVIWLVAMGEKKDGTQKWHPVDVPSKIATLRGEHHPDRLVVPRLKRIVACRVLSIEEQAEEAISDLVEGNVSHFATCPAADQFRGKTNG